MSNLKKDLEEIIDEHADAVLEARDETNTSRAVELQDEADQKAITQIINLIESELLTVREELIEQVRDKKPAKLKSVRGAKNVSSARIGYIDGWNAYYEKLQPILTDIKNKLIDGEKK